MSFRKFVVVLAVLAIPYGAAAQQAVSLTPEQMEVFLKEAKIISMRDAGNGTTRSRRATLTDGTITHDAHVQVVDEAKALFEAGAKTELNFKDSYRFNIAGYRLARLLGLDNVPMSVERRVEAKTAAVTWWIDDLQMDEKERLSRKALGPDPQRTSNQIAVMRVWDELIQNKDRNQGNIQWGNDWKLWLIDHTRAFRSGGKLLNPNQLTKIDSGLLERLRALKEADVTTALKGLVTSGEIKAVMRRRDELVKLFDARIAKLGEAAVFFTASTAPVPVP
jgi:hypothetical protein